MISVGPEIFIVDNALIFTETELTKCPVLMWFNGAKFLVSGDMEYEIIED